MKRTTIPNAKLGRGRRPSKLRAIDHGTRYDITGNLRRLVRSIERGEHGAVTDVLVMVRGTDGDGDLSRDAFHYGKSPIEVVYMMAEWLANRLLG